LANEFWYYLLFPLLLTIFVAGKMAERILSLLLAVAILLFLPKSILLSGLIWILGAAVYYLIHDDSIRGIVTHPLWLILGLLLTIGSLLASRSGLIGIVGEGADLVIGIGCAVLVAGLASRTSTNYYYGILSAGASEISYTLYLVHFPVLAFLFFGFFKGSQMTPGPTSGSWFAITLGGVLLYSVAIWWLFERNTDRVREIASRVV
jgi:peptidoglycan/LPS O-acetylase OafA/YrhL